MAQFSYKLTTESELFTFDFTPVLQPTETLTSATCTAITVQGTDPAPSAILSGTPNFASGLASQRVIGGLADNTYRLIMTCATNEGNIYTVTGDIPVYDPSEM